VRGRSPSAVILDEMDRVDEFRPTGLFDGIARWLGYVPLADLQELQETFRLTEVAHEEDRREEACVNEADRNYLERQNDLMAATVFRVRCDLEDVEQAFTTYREAVAGTPITADPEGGFYYHLKPPAFPL
jgi:hypothetical protein